MGAKNMATQKVMRMKNTGLLIFGILLLLMELVAYLWKKRINPVIGSSNY